MASYINVSAFSNFACLQLHLQLEYKIKAAISLKSSLSLNVES